MTRVTFRLPSKMTQYGYAEIEFESPYGPADTASLGAEYSAAVREFQAAERQMQDPAKPAINQIAPLIEDAAKKLIEAEVAAVEAAREQAKSAEPKYNTKAGAAKAIEPDSTSEDVAQALLEAELGATVVSEETPKVGDSVTVAGINFTKQSDSPWDEPAPPKAEPWKNQSVIEDLFA